LKNKTFSLSLSLPLLAAAFCALGLAAYAQGPAGWPTFSTVREGELSQFPVFTVSFPPGFNRKGNTRTNFQAVGARIDVADGNDPSKGWYFQMTVTIEAMSQEEEEIFEKSGPGPIWEVVLRNTRSTFNGSFSGLRTFDFKGYPAADADGAMIVTLPPEAGSKTHAGVLLTRDVIKAPFMYSALCMATGMTPEETLFDGFAIREVNAIAENCVPFLDSLELGE
jgi:hypothetical protein